MKRATGPAFGGAAAERMNAWNPPTARSSASALPSRRGTSGPPSASSASGAGGSATRSMRSTMSAASMRPPAMQERARLVLLHRARGQAPEQRAALLDRGVDRVRAGAQAGVEVAHRRSWSWKVLTDSHISAEIVSRSVRAPSRAASTQETIDTGFSASGREHAHHVVAPRRSVRLARAHDREQRFPRERDRGRVVRRGPAGPRGRGRRACGRCARPAPGGGRASRGRARSGRASAAPRLLLLLLLPAPAGLAHPGQRRRRERSPARRSRCRRHRPRAPRCPSSRRPASC